MTSASGSGLLAVAALLASGCGVFGTPRITRTVGGASRPGHYVSPFSYEHFIRGELAEMRGDLREAAEEYRLARAGPEDDPYVIARLADVLDRLGEEGAAMQLLLQGDAIDPNDESIWLARGHIHERHGRTDEAREAYAHAAGAAPRSEQGPIALAALLRAEDQGTEADAVLERYLTRAEGAGAARARLALAIDREDPLAASEAVHALLQAAPARAGEVRQAASTALRAGQPELALRLLAALPDDTPEDRPIRLRAMLEAGELERAEGLLATWMPRGPTEYVTVAEGYLAIGMPERAEELGRVALSAEGGPPARLLVGRALHARGRLGEAAEILAGIGPGSRAWPAAPLALSTTLRAAGQPALAAETLVAALAREPSVELRLELGEARLEAGDGAGALAALEGDDPTLRAAHARTLDRLGNHDEAVRAYRGVPLDDPRVPAADRVRARAEAAVRAGEPERAISLLRELVERAPENRAALLRLRALEAG